ncbi:hypothetical protein F0562_019731 [Nyssa sinensis]|uniref:Pentatricopeptide repeat-containing protein n=1 Tax=Nyssa sinensis TaxID=561372 RepID=A0A5J5BQE7_9ASTE|nr:hypothetical protein F0562_019731 [Nyssa sinensis]
MEEEGSCAPGIVEYNTIIDGLCKGRLMTVALELISEMIGKGIPPNLVSYNCLIQGTCNCETRRQLLISSILNLGSNN